MTPAYPGLPLAYPVNTVDVAPPPLSLVKDYPVNPAYVPGLPGLPQGKAEPNATGAMAKKSDGLFIRQSKVENGQVVIPPGGLYYLEDGGGMVALQGQTAYFLGHEPIYIEFDMIIDLKKNVTIPAGSSVVVGSQVYLNLVGIGHGATRSQTLSVRTIAGTDWEWAFGAPVFSANQTNWWAGNIFKMLYNQGQVREVSSTQLVFDWLSGVRMERLLFANTKVFYGFAKAGQEWPAGNRTIRLSEVNQTAGTAKIQILESGAVAFEKTLGPIDATRLIEDRDARKAVVFEYKDLAGYLVYTEAFKDGQAQLRLYAGRFQPQLRFGLCEGHALRCLACRVSFRAQLRHHVDQQGGDDHSGRRERYRTGRVLQDSRRQYQEWRSPRMARRRQQGQQVDEPGWTGHHQHRPCPRPGQGGRLRYAERRWQSCLGSNVYYIAKPIRLG